MFKRGRVERRPRSDVPDGRVDDQDHPRALGVVLLDEAEPLAEEDLGLCEKWMRMRVCVGR